MLVDIVGKVRNTQLPLSKPLLPLYEAIINSIEAIEDANNTNGRIDVFIKREKGGLEDRDGNVLDTIVGFAHKSRFDVIVIGSRGLGTPKASYIGSVAHGIVNNSKVPVLVVK